MTKPEKPGDRVEHYLVELLSDEYGAEHVCVGEPTPGEFATPALGVEMRDDTYDRLGWAVCHAVVRGAFKKVERMSNLDRAAEVLNHVVETVREGVRRGLPVVDGEGPPWYNVAVSDVRIHLKADVATFEIGCDFSTGLVPAGAKE